MVLGKHQPPSTFRPSCSQAGEKLIYTETLSVQRQVLRLVMKSKSSCSVDYKELMIGTLWNYTFVDGDHKADSTVTGSGECLTSEQRLLSRSSLKVRVLLLLTL